MRSRIAVLASGGGTNFQALLDAWRAGSFADTQIVLAVSDREKAGALDRARHLEIPAIFLDPGNYQDAAAYDLALLAILKEHRVNTLCLAGYLRILTPAVIAALPNRILNIHPSLLPAFGGAGMYGHRVHEAVLASGAKFSGCTVHFVDEGTDTGPIVLQHVVPVLDNDTPESLAERVLIEEHRLYPRALALLCEGRLRVSGKRVHIEEKA